MADRTSCPVSHSSLDRPDVRNVESVEVLPVPVGPTRRTGNEWCVRVRTKKVYRSVSSVGIRTLVWVEPPRVGSKWSVGWVSVAWDRENE